MYYYVNFFVIKSSKFELVNLEARIACHIQMWEHLDSNCPLYQGLSNKFAVTDTKYILPNIYKKVVYSYCNTVLNLLEM